MIPAPTPAQAALILLNLGLLAAMVTAWAWAAYRLVTGRGLLPPAKPRPVPWQGKAVLAVLLAWVALQFVVPAVYFGLAGFGRRNPDGRLEIGPADKILLTLLVNLPIVAVGAFILRRMAGATATDYGLEPRRIVSESVRGVVAWPILAPIVFGVNFLVLRIDPNRAIHPIQQWAELRPGGATWLALAFSAVVAAPLAEEFLFRGVLLGWLGRRALTKPAPPDDLSEIGPDPNFAPRPPAPATVGRRLIMANVWVSFLFAAMHGQVWPTPIPLFFFSLALGAL